MADHDSDAEAEVAFGMQPKAAAAAASASNGRKDKKPPVQTLSVDFDAILPHIGEMGRYQIVLYLLMCIPATLPAAFLAFNQVFLSATPDHWCHVSELASFGNLSLGLIKNLSIPRVNFGGSESSYLLYEKCQQYNVNFTQIFEENGHKWPSMADPTWPRSACREGWDYDKSEYKDTLVTEVAHAGK